MLPQLFSYEGQQLRTVVKDGEPWFVARDEMKLSDYFAKHWNITPEEVIQGYCAFAFLGNEAECAEPFKHKEECRVCWANEINPESNKYIPTTE